MPTRDLVQRIHSSGEVVYLLHKGTQFKIRARWKDSCCFIRLALILERTPFHMLAQTCVELHLMKEGLREDSVFQGLLHLFPTGLREDGGQVKLCLDLIRVSPGVEVVISVH